MCVLKGVYKYFFLFGLVWLLDGRFAVLAAPSMRLLCVCPERCLQVLFLVWAGVAVGWLVDFQFTSQRLFFLVWAGVALGWLVDFQFTFQRLAIVCLEREESMRKSWMQVLDAGSALYV